jgi:hypothetical protein
MNAYWVGVMGGVALGFALGAAYVMVAVYTGRMLSRRPPDRWVNMTDHDISVTAGGILHHSTCWCKKQKETI